MSDFLKKLNVLVRANLRNILGESRSPSIKSKGELKSHLLQLRQRVDQALQHEQHLEQQLIQLDEEVQQLDADADAALARGEVDAARELIARLKKAEKRRARVATDLKAHQMALDELRFQVDRFEAALEQAEERTMRQQKRAAIDREVIADVEQAESQYVRVLGQAPEAPPDVASVEPQDVEDDLSARLRRLSKPDKDE
ncbi:MAG: hypothetical protein D6712_00220 [Chloroflexi bacterium]|nr:MAG: hypothetical protein D6712_00220 [Chloroflexota bacterium]